MDLDNRLVHERATTRYCLRPDRDFYTPATQEDARDWTISKTAKLLVLLDRAKFLEEHGFKAHVMNYQDNHSWVNANPEHLLYATK